MAIEYANEKPILVIPGIELSCTQGHLLLYFGDFDALQKFYGKLDFSKDKKTCNHTIPQCLEIAAKYDGVGIAAHIDQDAGFESVVSGYGPFKEAILECPNLLALELTKAENESWYSDRDLNDNRKRIFEKRREALKLDNVYDMARVLFSDAHSLAVLGRNASGNNKITRFKMDSLSFPAFKNALLDATARTRIEDLLPTAIPHFVGIMFEGGFLDGQIIRFSKNLTCIIGGRGTGKSTSLEALRAASGNNARESLVDSEVWPENVYLIWEDESGRKQLLVREKYGNVRNDSDPRDGLLYLPIESYGQGETAERIQHCDKDPNVLLEFLDSFGDFGNLKFEDETIREQLLQNQTLLERLELDINGIPDVTRALNNAKAQQNALKDQNASEVIELETSIVQERNFRVKLIKDLEMLINSIRTCLKSDSIDVLIKNLDPESLVAGKEDYDAIKQILEMFSKTIRTFSGDIENQSNTLITEINKHLRHWNDNEKLIQQKIDNIRNALAEKGVKLDISFIKKNCS